MVTSKPKRISVADGVVHMIHLLFSINKIRPHNKQTFLIVACLYDCIMRQVFSKEAAGWY